MDELMRIEDVAPRVGLSTQALYHACRQRQFPHVRIGRRIRVPASALATWIATQIARNTVAAGAAQSQVPASAGTQ